MQYDRDEYIKSYIPREKVKRTKQIVSATIDAYVTYMEYGPVLIQLIRELTLSILLPMLIILVGIWIPAVVIVLVRILVLTQVITVVMFLFSYNFTRLRKRLNEHDTH